MKPKRALGPLLAAALLTALPFAHAADPCSEACQALVREGQALQAQGQYAQAYARFKAASSASPSASVPASSAAALMYLMSTAAKPEQADKLRAGARDMASQAARLAPTDPVAQEVLRMLDDGPSPPLHAPSPEVARLVEQAEVLFAQQRYADALGIYEQVTRADPAYSPGWVNAGDCYYMQKDWQQAQAMFQRATEAEPRNAQAWRFLSDALAAQGKRDAAEAALESGIAADPSQRPSWSKLAQLRTHGGLPLKRLDLRRGTRLAQGAGGKFTIELDDWVLKTPETPDTAMRLSLALAEAEARGAAVDKAAGQTEGKHASVYEAELAAWRTALKVADELKTNTGKDLSDPALVRMQALARDGQLEPAILILLFRQAYRPQLEAWLAAHPDGVKAFIDRYGLQP